MSESGSKNSSTKLSPREYIAIGIALVTLSSTAFYTFLGYQRSDDRYRLESSVSKRRALIEERKYKVETRDKLREELNQTLDSAFSKRGVAYLASRLVGIIPSEVGDSSYEKAYLWMGHRIQNQLIIQKSFELITSIQLISNEIASITDSIGVENSLSDDRIKPSSNVNEASATDGC